MYGLFSLVCRFVVAARVLFVIGTWCVCVVVFVLFFCVCVVLPWLLCLHVLLFARVV